MCSTILYNTLPLVNNISWPISYHYTNKQTKNNVSKYTGLLYSHSIVLNSHVDWINGLDMLFPNGVLIDKNNIEDIKIDLPIYKRLEHLLSNSDRRIDYRQYLVVRKSKFIKWCTTKRKGEERRERNRERGWDTATWIRQGSFKYLC